MYTDNSVPVHITHCLFTATPVLPVYRQVKVYVTVVKKQPTNILPVFLSGNESDQPKNHHHLHLQIFIVHPAPYDVLPLQPGVQPGEHPLPLLHPSYVWGGDKTPVHPTSPCTVPDGRDT